MMQRDNRIAAPRPEACGPSPEVTRQPQVIEVIQSQDIALGNLEASFNALLDKLKPVICQTDATVSQGPPADPKYTAPLAITLDGFETRITNIVNGINYICNVLAI